MGTLNRFYLSLPPLSLTKLIYPPTTTYSTYFHTNFSFLIKDLPRKVDK